MSKRYVALVGLRYPDGPEEDRKALAGEPYKEVVVKAGEPLVGVSEANIEAYLSMGRPVIEEAAVKSRAPKAVSKP